MSFPLPLYQLILLIAFLWASDLVSHAANAQTSDRKILLLKTGNVIEGVPITRRDQVRVEFPGGDYIQIAAQRIEKQFTSRQNLFRYKSAVTEMTVPAQAELIQWYLEQNAFGPARNQIAFCVERGLEIPVEKWEQEIALRSGEKPPLIVNSKQAQTHSKRDQSFDQFTTQIEKHFVMGCGISGCHGTKQENGFALASTFGQKQTRAQSQANFQMITGIIEKSSQTGTAGSDLLMKRFTEKHGTLRSGVYSKRSTAYFEVLAWVNRHRKLASSNKEISPKISDSIPPSLNAQSKPAPRITNGTTAPNSVPVFQKTNAPQIEPAKQQPPVVAKPSIANSASTERQSLLHSNPSQWTPRDEFDPEIFNRMNRVAQPIQTRPTVNSTGSTAAPSRLTTSNQEVDKTIK